MQLNCDGCGIAFERTLGEVNRSQRLGRGSFCSRPCMGKSQLDHIPLDKRHNTEHLPHGRIIDEFSPFRNHLSRLRGRKHDVIVTLHDLKAQWELQGGRCALTGWDLEIDPTSVQGGEYTPRRASLDRIDSTVGYLPGNIQWLGVMANYAKGRFSMADVIAFAHAIAETHP